MSEKKNVQHEGLCPEPMMGALEVHRLLLDWYEQHKRDLPWREIDNPYHVLVSEIMLQQTQVDRVIPKYLTWLERYPTLEALAAAPTSDVIRDWAGLGYNRRAVNLQRLAQQVTEQLGGKLPATIPELIALPGIGRYTAGAVACFGFRAQVATVDTNIRRVLERVFCGNLEPELGERKVLELAETVLPDGEAYNWNQALMDLGATICTAAAPDCPRCPLAGVCRARPQFDALRYPDGMAQATLWGEVPAPVRLKRKADKPKSVQDKLPFTATRRYFRGRIVESLRALLPHETLSLLVLGPAIKPDFSVQSPADRAWLLELVHGLAKDGLVRVVVPQAENRIAEVKATYTAVSEENQYDSEWESIRVMLP